MNRNIHFRPRIPYFVDVGLHRNRLQPNTLTRGRTPRAYLRNRTKYYDHDRPSMAEQDMSCEFWKNRVSRNSSDQIDPCSNFNVYESTEHPYPVQPADSDFIDIEDDRVEETHFESWENEVKKRERIWEEGYLRNKVVSKEVKASTYSEKLLTPAELNKTKNNGSGNSIPEVPRAVVVKLNRKDKSQSVSMSYPPSTSISTDITQVSEIKMDTNESNYSTDSVRNVEMSIPIRNEERRNLLSLTEPIIENKCEEISRIPETLMTVSVKLEKFDPSYLDSENFNSSITDVTNTITAEGTQDPEIADNVSYSSVAIKIEKLHKARQISTLEDNLDLDYEPIDSSESEFNVFESNTEAGTAVSNYDCDDCWIEKVITPPISNQISWSNENTKSYRPGCLRVLEMYHHSNDSIPISDTLPFQQRKQKHKLDRCIRIELQRIDSSHGILKTSKNILVNPKNGFKANNPLENLNSDARTPTPDQNVTLPIEFDKSDQSETISTSPKDIAPEYTRNVNSSIVNNKLMKSARLEATHKNGEETVHEEMRETIKKVSPTSFPAEGLIQNLSVGSEAENHKTTESTVLVNTDVQVPERGNTPPLPRVSIKNQENFKAAENRPESGIGNQEIISNSSILELSKTTAKISNEIRGKRGPNLSGARTKYDKSSQRLEKLNSSILGKSISTVGQKSQSELRKPEKSSINNRERNVNSSRDRTKCFRNETRTKNQRLNEEVCRNNRDSSNFLQQSVEPSASSYMKYPTNNLSPQNQTLSYEGVKFVSTARIIARQRELDERERNLREQQLKLNAIMAEMRQPIYYEPRPPIDPAAHFASPNNYSFERHGSKSNEFFGHSNLPEQIPFDSPYLPCMPQNERFVRLRGAEQSPNPWNFENHCQNLDGTRDHSNYSERFLEPQINEPFQRNSEMGPWSWTNNMAGDEFDERRFSTFSNFQPRATRKKFNKRNKLHPKPGQPIKEESPVRHQFLSSEPPSSRRKTICTVCHVPGHPTSICRYRKKWKLPFRQS